MQENGSARAAACSSASPDRASGRHRPGRDVHDPTRRDLRRELRRRRRRSPAGAGGQRKRIAGRGSCRSQFSCMTRTFGESSRLFSPSSSSSENWVIFRNHCEAAPFNQSAGTPSTAVDELLVREHRHVDRSQLTSLSLRSSGPPRTDERTGLLMPVISRIAGHELERPWSAKPIYFGSAHMASILAEVHAPGCTFVPYAAFSADIARRASPSGRDLESLRSPIARDDVAHGVIADMAISNAPEDMGTSRALGLGLRRSAVGLNAALFLPPRLPAAVGRVRVRTPADRDSIMPRQWLGADRGPWSG